MRARHRLSKLLLRHGHRLRRRAGLDRRARRLAARGSASTVAGDAGRRSTPTTRPCWRTAPAGTGSTTRSPRWPRDSEFTPIVRRLGCLRGISTLTGFALAVEIGDWNRFSGNSIGAFVGLTPSEHSSGQSRGAGLDHQDRQRPRPPAAGRSRLAPPRPLPAREDDAATGGRSPRPPPGSAAMPGTGGCTDRGCGSSAPQEAPHHRQRRHRPRTGRLVLVPGHPRRRRHSRSRPVVRSQRLASSARSDPRFSYEQPTSPRPATLDPRHADSSSRTAPSCGNQPAHISLTGVANDTLTTKINNASRGAAENPSRRRLTLPLDRQSLHISCRGPRGRCRRCR